MLTTLPPHGEATFMVALLVSTSMTSWSAAMQSPGLTRKLTIVASAMDSPNCGMMMGSCFMLHLQQIPRGGAHALRRGAMHQPKIGMVGNRRILGVEALRRRVQQPKTFRRHAR